MTPAARVQAAIEVLAQVQSGVAAEKALTNWARGARYAGSGDRAAVRDHVFDVMRTRRSSAALGGGTSPRQLMIGHQRQAGHDLDAVFDGSRHGPQSLTQAEIDTFGTPTEADRADLPDWLWQAFRTSLGTEAPNVAETLRHRAPVFLRVNGLRATVAQAKARLIEDGVETEPVETVATALRVTRNARRVQNAAAYRDGLVELQDASSQTVVNLLPLRAGQGVLDYCAGGGGKALALAARVGGAVVAHDSDPNRMRDLPARAARAGAAVEIAAKPRGTFDLVLCDAPCSGSGAWRRSPEGKWALTPERLETLREVQLNILMEASEFVSHSGHLAYVTCSVLETENADRIGAFLAMHPDWCQSQSQQILPGADGDGFFLSVLHRDP